MRSLIKLSGMALLVGIAIWLGLRAGSSDQAMPQVPPLRAATAVVAGTGPAADMAPEPSQEARAALVRQLTGITTMPASSPSPEAVAPTPSELDGPAKVEAWLASSTDLPTVANTIFAGFPTLKPEDQLLAVSKLVALVSDDRFEGLKRLLLDPKTTAEAKEFLFRDALGRAESLKLPLLLAIMQKPDHPCAAEARQTLTTQLGVDCGMNYGQWQAKIIEVLRAP